MRFVVNVRLDGEPNMVSGIIVAQDYTAAVQDIQTQLAAGFVQIYDIDAQIHHIIPNIDRIVRYVVVDEEVYKVMAIFNQNRPPPAPNSGGMSST